MDLSLSYLAVMTVLGLAGGFFSGLLGIGGAIIMVPLLLYVPPWLGLPALNMKEVAAISIVQVTFASLAAAVVHWRNGFVSRPLVLTMGLTGATASFAGAYLSRQVHPDTLLLVFAVVSALAAGLMLVPRQEWGEGVAADEVAFNRPLAVAIALAVGLVGGLVGAPGAFIYVPLFLYVLRIPTRVTLGSTLVIVLLGSVFGLVGKMATAQVPMAPALALVIGALPGAQVGGQWSKHLPAPLLRGLVAVVVLVSTAKVWAQVIHTAVFRDLVDAVEVSRIPTAGALALLGLAGLIALAWGVRRCVTSDKGGAD